MSSSDRNGLASGATARKFLLAAGIAGTAALGGCSADLGRFDFKGSGLSSDQHRARNAPLPAEPMRRGAGGPADEGPDAPAPSYTYNPAPYAPPAAAHAPVRQAGLPEPVSREPAWSPGSDRFGRGAPSAAPVASPVVAQAEAGNTVEVQAGDTLYGISRRHKVSISELMSVNGLQNPTIRPGQRLTLPSGARRGVAKRTETARLSRPEPVSPPPARSVAAAPAASPAAQEVAVAPAPADWSGTYTVTPKDSLYNIARRFNVKVADLQSYNGIPDPTKLRAGAVLKVPGGAAAGASPQIAAAEPAPVTVAPPTATDARPPVGAAPSWGGSGPTIINQRTAPAERVAAVTPPKSTMTDAPAPAAKDKATPVSAPAAAGPPEKFRWPAKGRVIASFGPRGDNTHNDGINILVPQGTDVHAAEAGVVAYAGNELKGYGNLVLIRHGGNWVSAYAHNESLLVKRGDKVERGQAIAKAGKTGAVDQPQVHFELRRGSKPIDPLPHLEK
jgi:murein DD-endopeptidase MepM/ murein hydrolase activator NlpD